MAQPPHTGGKRGIVPDFWTAGITRRLRVHDPLLNPPNFANTIGKPTDKLCYQSQFLSPLSSSDNLSLSAPSEGHAPIDAGNASTRGKEIFASCRPRSRCSGSRSALGACRPTPWRGDAVGWHVLGGNKVKLPRRCPCRGCHWLGRGRNREYLEL